MYGKVRGAGRQHLIARKRTNAFAPIVLELAGHYINLLVIQKLTSKSEFTGN